MKMPNQILKAVLLFVCLYLLFSAAELSAQYNITGVVSDVSTGEKLSDASVYLFDLHKAVYTDSAGAYRFSALPGGFLKIQFSLLGYRPLEMTIETDKITDSLNVALIPDEIQTEEITVFENGIERSYPIEKISYKELMRYGSINISEAVSKIPGVWQLSTGTGISKPVIRGLYGNRIGIMVNGIRFDNQQWQDEHGLVMSSDGIDNIEVIKGPRSLLYGPEAIGGVVSITDEHPAPIGKETADLNLKFFDNTLGILGDIGMKGAQKNYN
ncbi:MAG TPA: TonB-dependent receptor plug domain-containing protein, partial [Ignavibacteria bacterium]|nr:TonB-dependent receptor plug domain-containing protein [Ignavibacteria bacterium]